MHIHLRPNGSEGDGELIVERSEEVILRNSRMSPGVSCADRRNEGEGRQEGDGSDLVDLDGNGSGEEESLSRGDISFWERSDNFDQFLTETLFKQSIRFVENEDLEVRELVLERRVLEMIDHSSRGSDENIATTVVSLL